MKERSIDKEVHVYGERWQTIHDGYFSDPKAAAALLDEVEKIVEISHPSAIADLGGGTGFILRELARRLDLPGLRLINVDISPEQLYACDDRRIIAIQASASRFTRNRLHAEEGELLLIVRSLLHYFGRSDVRHLLRHIRCQLKSGEFFIHQSACFLHSEDAGCMNLIYSLMGTDKWYGTIDEMEKILDEEGWEVCRTIPAPKLHLSSQDLSERYDFSPVRVKMIQDEVERHYGQRPGIFAITDVGFDAWLHYRIFVCRAK